MKTSDLNNLLTPVVDFEWALDEWDAAMPFDLSWCDKLPECIPPPPQ